MQWKPISDLPANWHSLISTEVESLAQTWEQTYQELKDTPMLVTFNERLRREWSIETGIIERVYTIDRGTTQLLIEKGIDSAYITHGATGGRPVGEVLQIIRDQHEALDGIFAYVSQKQPLTLHYIRTLHQVLLRHQDSTEGQDQFGNVAVVALIKGDWKDLPNNPQCPDGTVHEYCPPEQVQSEMERLIEMHQEHTEQNVNPQVEAAWLHHRFTQIHPFQDGNGRVARCLATLVFIRAERFPLVINRDQREEYISALEQADAGDLAPLVRLFHRLQKRAYLQALNLSEDILQTTTPLAQIIAGIAERSQKRQQAQFDRVFAVAENLLIVAQETMNKCANEISQQFKQFGLPNIDARVCASDARKVHWYQGDIIKIAQKLDYYANLSRPRLWIRLRIKDLDRIVASDVEIVVSLHYIGKQNRGVMIATAFLNIIHQPGDMSEHDDDQSEPLPFRETHPIIEEGFTFTHTDADTAYLERRQVEFRDWLEQAIAVGLAEWQRQL